MTLELADRLRQSLIRGDDAELLAGDMAETDLGKGMPAAVLIAITKAAQPGVVLTVRREHLRTHPGQVAFPGGRIDPGGCRRRSAARSARGTAA